MPRNSGTCAFNGLKADIKLILAWKLKFYVVNKFFQYIRNVFAKYTI